MREQKCCDRVGIVTQFNAKAVTRGHCCDSDTDCDSGVTKLVNVKGLAPTSQVLVGCSTTCCTRSFCFVAPPVWCVLPFITYPHWGNPPLARPPNKASSCTLSVREDCCWHTLSIFSFLVGQRGDIWGPGDVLTCRKWIRGPHCPFRGILEHLFLWNCFFFDKQRN